MLPSDLQENQEKRFYEAPCGFVSAYSIFEEYVEGVLSSAYPAKSMFSGVSKNISQIQISNKSGQRIDPCGTPEGNISQELKALSTLVLCLRLVR